MYILNYNCQFYNTNYVLLTYYSYLFIRNITSENTNNVFATSKYLFV